jgi:hypothetical protein
MIWKILKVKKKKKKKIICKHTQMILLHFFFIFVCFLFVCLLGSSNNPSVPALPTYLNNPDNYFDAAVGFSPEIAHDGSYQPNPLQRQHSSNAEAELSDIPVVSEHRKRTGDMEMTEYNN